MSLPDRIAEIRRLVEDARSMPMSASVVVNRAELVAMLDALETEAHAELAEAARVVSDKDDVVGEGHRQVTELLDEARVEQERLASETEVLRRAREEAQTLLSEARAEAAATRAETDDYVDRKLAGFEVSLERILETVRRGRERLAGSGSLDMGAGGDVSLPEHLER